VSGGVGARLGLADAGLEPRTSLAFLEGVLQAYVPPSAAQAEERARMLAFLQEHEAPLERRCLAGHFTASALVIHADGERALLTHHRKLKRWLQLGGHCDGEANPARAALIEATEESGIEQLSIDPSPVDLDIHRIPARAGEPEHLHLDLRYLVYAAPGAREVIGEESLDLAWVSTDELAGLDSDDSVRRLFELAFG